MPDSDHDGAIYADFTMDCPTCGPKTIVFENGKQKPHGCPYEPPSLLALRHHEGRPGRRPLLYEVAKRRNARLPDALSLAPRTPQGRKANGHADLP